MLTEGKMNGKEFADLLVALREQKNISQAQLARDLNVTTSAISKWENGKNFPDISTFERIAEYYGVSYGDMHRTKETLEQVKNHTYQYIASPVEEKEPETQQAQSMEEESEQSSAMPGLNQSGGNWKSRLSYGFAFLWSLYLLVSWIIHEIKL